TELKAEEHRITHLDRKSEIRANDHLTVAVTQHANIGTAQFVEAGQEIHYKTGNIVVLEAGAELTAKAGGSFVKLDGGGVTISGADVKINSGGAPGVGTPAAPLLPGLLKLADADKAGGLLLGRLNAPIPRLAPPKGICVECLLKAIRQRQAILSGAQP
ncbi:type VI secretion system tip protein VgrG, partial [Pseudomonas sp. RW409]